MSREVAAHFRADFLSRRCFTMCINSGKLNLESRRSTNANTVTVAKITVERGWRMGEKKRVFASFFLADQKIASL